MTKGMKRGAMKHYPWGSLALGGSLGALNGWLIAFIVQPLFPERQMELAANGPLTIFLVLFAAFVGAFIMHLTRR